MSNVFISSFYCEPQEIAALVAIPKDILISLLGDFLQKEMNASLNSLWTEGLGYFQRKTY